MALLNPVYSLILPFLFLFTIPIAFFASITTTLAFSILIFRVILVYIELAFAVIPFWILGPKPSLKDALQRSKSFSSPPATIIPARRRKRRGSTSSSLSATGSITPVSAENVRGFSSHSIGASRDFEGVGGWRLGNESDDEEEVWTKINSRLELPADHDRRRHHHRSLTSGSLPGDSRKMGFDKEAMNTSRPRTPTSGITGEGYFPQTPVSGKGSKKTGSLNGGASGSSGSSKGSSVVSMKHR